MPFLRLGESVIRLVWRHWGMWIVRTIAGKRGLRRDWKNISNRLCRLRFVRSSPVWKSKFYDAFVLNHIVVLHAIDATPARWRDDADSSPLDGTSAATPSLRNDLVKNCRVHLMHWLISTQVAAVLAGAVPGEGARLDLRRLALRAVVGDAHFFFWLSVR